MDRLAVKVCSASALGDETFFLECVEDDRDADFPTIFVGDRHTELRVAMSEVSRAIERIDNPSMFALVRVGAAFFGEDRVGRKGPLQNVDDRGLGLLVGLSDKVNRIGLAGYAGTAKPFKMDACSRPRRPERHFMDFDAVGHGSKLCE